MKRSGALLLERRKAQQFNEQALLSARFTFLYAAYKSDIHRGPFHPRCGYLKAFFPTNWSTFTPKMHVVPSSLHHTHTIIFLHGRDSEAAEFASELFESQASDGRTLRDIVPHVKWVFPSTIPILSERFGINMSQWFDMWSTENPNEREEKQNLQPSISQIKEVIDNEAFLVGSIQNVFLGGISQGCALAIHALLANPDCRMAGFVGLSSWLPKPQELIPCNALSTPIHLQHNSDDPVMDVKRGRKLRDRLEGLALNVDWHEYEKGGHWLNEPMGVDDMASFLQTAMQQSPE